MEPTGEGDRARPPPEERTVSERPALRAAAVYALLGAGWILLSDRVVDALFEDPRARSLAQTIKGWGYVAVTAVLAFALVGKVARERARAERARVLAIEREREQLERHALELRRRVEEATAELQQRNADLGAFAHSAAHDLRAPLRAMHGFAAALLEDRGEALGEEGRDHAERILRATVRMDRLISDLLAYSRLTRENLTLVRAPLEHVVDEALALLRGDIEESGALVEVDRELPAVEADPAVLTRVVMNLVANALKFVEPGVRPELRLGATTQGGWVRLSVSDNGIGIAPEHRERIFQPLERLHGVERYPGTGIGLAIVRRGVERMGGRCGVESEPGRGSTFWVELRVATAQVGPGPAEEA